MGVAADEPDRSASCMSRLWRPLVPGFPAEFAQPVLDGLIRQPSLPAGTLTIDRAGYDPVESSPLAFELTAELLAIVIATLIEDGDVKKVARQAMIRWP